MERIEQLSALLAQSLKSHDELETTLKLAKSNLQLALANNEMLEEALKRESVSGGKDLGWRRWSEHPDQRRVRGAVKDASLERRSTDGLSPSSSQVTLSSFPSSSPLAASFTPTSDSSGSTPTSPAMLPPVSPQPTPQPSASSQDTRFFRFRFGGGSSSPNLASSSASKPKPPSRPQSPQPQSVRKSALVEATHLTSTSLPSLPSDSKETELLAELEAERSKSLAVAKEKANLEAELEGLSQALFEEANKMVAQERIKCAEMEEELKQTQREKDAMKSAMRIVEQENESLKKSKQEEKQRVGNLDIVNSIARALREDSHKSDPPSPLRPRTPATHEPESELDSEPQVTPLDNQSSTKPPSDRLRNFTFPPRSWTSSNSALPSSPLPDMPLEESPWGK